MTPVSPREFDLVSWSLPKTSSTVPTTVVSPYWSITRSNLNYLLEDTDRDSIIISIPVPVPIRNIVGPFVRVDSFFQWDYFSSTRDLSTTIEYPPETLKKKVKRSK